MGSMSELLAAHRMRFPEPDVSQGGGGGIIEAIAKAMDERKKEAERQQTALKNDIEMYKTMREAGYQPAEAQEALQTKKLPKTPGGLTTDELKAQREEKQAQAELDKTTAETEETHLDVRRKQLEDKLLNKMINGETLRPAEEKYYTDTIRKRGYIQSDVKDDILTKKANGETLTPGEEQIYEDVIKRSTGTSGGGASDIDRITAARSGQKIVTPAVNQEEMVKVYSPDGKPASLPKRNLQKALKQGYKLR